MAIRKGTIKIPRKNYLRLIKQLLNKEWPDSLSVDSISHKIGLPLREVALLILDNFDQFDVHASIIGRASICYHGKSAAL